MEGLVETGRNYEDRGGRGVISLSTYFTACIAILLIFPVQQPMRTGDSIFFSRRKTGDSKRHIF
jgi:hypothetical protein